MLLNYYQLDGSTKLVLLVVLGFCDWVDNIAGKFHAYINAHVNAVFCQD